MFKLMNIFDDPTGGIINLRFIKHLMSLTEYAELTDGEKQQFFNLLV